PARASASFPGTRVTTSSSTSAPSAAKATGYSKKASASSSSSHAGRRACRPRTYNPSIENRERSRRPGTPAGGHRSVMGWRLILVRCPWQRRCQSGLPPSHQLHRPRQSLQFRLLLAHHVIKRLKGVVLKRQPDLDIIHPLYKTIAPPRKPAQ